FTYPQELADELGKTAADLQESLYRYHTNAFRVPTTTISLPTDGMIGEAVLGETNVSEKIDITRFWNWKDSPIDKMEINNSYLNNTDYLADKTTKDIAALNLAGADAPTARDFNDLISVLAAKQTPSFENITGLDQLKEIVNQATQSAAAGRKEALDTSFQYANSAMQAYQALAAKEMDVKIEAEKAKTEIAKAEIAQAGNKAGTGTGDKANAGTGEKTGASTADKASTGTGDKAAASTGTGGAGGGSGTGSGASGGNSNVVNICGLAASCPLLVNSSAKPEEKTEASKTGEAAKTTEAPITAETPTVEEAAKAEEKE
ncbi:MAG: hypothetical protein FWF04_05200, partial [Clostridiales bacterium]|nr:hypothetical protein [Clostridiales bacterium]